jgi:signal transduction histidine kinase
VRVEGDGARLAIEDDGPGLSETDALAVLERGKRLDETGDGQGFGLAIAHELARASGAAMTLTRSTLGGLRVEIAWA